MLTERKSISEFEKIGKMRIRSSVLLNKISTVTDDFFVNHSRSITDQEWSQLMDKIVDIVNTQRP